MRLKFQAIFQPKVELFTGEYIMIEGNTAWILISTVLVLFMTLPGLALFYGGLVYSKNLISVLIQWYYHLIKSKKELIFYKYAIEKNK